MAALPQDRRVEIRFAALTGEMFCRIGKDLPAELVKRLVAYADKTGEDVTGLVEDAIALHLDAAEPFDPRALAETMDYPT